MHHVPDRKCGHDGRGKVAQRFDRPRRGIPVEVGGVGDREHERERQEGQHDLEQKASLPGPPGGPLHGEGDDDRPGRRQHDARPGDAALLAGGQDARGRADHQPRADPGEHAAEHEQLSAARGAARR